MSTPPCACFAEGYAQGPNAPRTVIAASELRYKDILDAARVFNRLVATKSDQPIS